MYSREEKKRVVRLFIKFGKNAVVAINELGYPEARGFICVIP